MRHVFLIFSLVFFGTFYTSSSFGQVDPEILSEETLKRFKRVPEFEFIIQQAHQQGLKVYLFGGTASAFAHYVRWDLEREAGDTKYQKERFDYDFTNIYRGNQDLDIVIDGAPEEAEKFKNILQKSYPHFIGNRDAWEVRLLRQSKGDKRALIGDEDFKKQHSDTNSTGMLLLNPDPQGIVYNDLLNWGSKESDFLNDVAAARIKFLFGKEHEQTDRFKKGLNPPVLAAIRYLAKLAQYEVKGTKEDFTLVTKIITQTNFTKISEYGKKKAEEFALKTLLNAPDSEYAWNLLDKTGARKKLVEMDGNRFDESETLSWWMNKEPLRSKDFGSDGKTAREIFETDEIIVSHETNSFRAYDNITRSSKGGANAFISRIGVVGEIAAAGEGFYTKLGLTGARGTGLTIRFKLHPDAREGSDFKRRGDYVLILNKNALTLIQENLNISPIDLINALIRNELNYSDRGLIEKFKRKFDRLTIATGDLEEIAQEIKEYFYIAELYDKDQLDPQLIMKASSFSELSDLLTDQMDRFFTQLLMEKIEKYELDHAALILKKVLEKTKRYSFVLNDVLSAPFWSQRPDLVEMIINREDVELIEHLYLASNILSRSHWKNHPEWVELLINQDNPMIDEYLMRHVLSQSHWKHHPEWIEKLLLRGHNLDMLMQHVLAKPHVKPNLEWIKIIMKEKSNHAKLLTYVLSQPHWEEPGRPILEKILYSNKKNPSFAFHILSKPHFNHKKEWIEFFLHLGNADTTLITYVLVQPHWKDETEWVDHLLAKEKNGPALAEHVLSKSHWDKAKALEWIKILFDRGQVDSAIALHVLSKSYWADHPEFIEHLLSKNDLYLDGDIARGSLSKPHWSHHPEWVERLLDKNDGRLNKILAKTVVSKAHWTDYPEWIEKLINRGGADKVITTFILAKKHWQQHPEVKEYLAGKFTATQWRTRAKKISFSEWRQQRKRKTHQWQCTNILKTP